MPITSCWKSTAASRSGTRSAVCPMRVIISVSLAFRGGVVACQELVERARRAAGDAADGVGRCAVRAACKVGGHPQRVVDVEGGGPLAAQRDRGQTRRHVDIPGAEAD